MIDNHSTTELSPFGMSSDAWRQRLFNSLMLTTDSTAAKKEGEMTKIWVYNDIMMLVITIIIS
jgi:hypothetical protein